MKPAPLEYARPDSLEEALELLADHGDEAKVLAGGQSLVPLLNMRLARPALLIDINHVRNLDNVAHNGGGEARVGALVRQGSAGEISRLVDACLPHIGHFVTRNRGTVGGSIAHADAKAELPLALLVQGGSVVAATRAGRREIAAEDFFVTHFTTALEAGELVVETVWPTLDRFGIGFEEFALRSGDYALAMAAVALRVEDGRATGTRVGVGATVDRPTLLAEVAALVDGHALDAELARQAGAVAASAVDPADGLHASAAYQRHLTGLLVERTLIRAWADAQEGQAA